MKDLCPCVEKCEIFKGFLKDKIFISRSYKSVYCDAGADGRIKCKRYLCREKFGQVPLDLLPNSDKTIEQIGMENDWQ
jgi:hypothetical protein